jgi:hypothetical protein
LRPAPQGWLWVKNVNQAQKALASGKVEAASLDHDLGDQIQPCAECEGELQPCEDCHCHQRPSNGCDLVAWCVATGHWPTGQKPDVHSANPPGAANMRKMIEQHYPSQLEPSPTSSPPTATPSGSAFPAKNS